MEITGILVAIGVLILLGLCWFGFHYWANPPMQAPDAEARVTGNCGDTMEISLQFEGDKVAGVRHWTDGCSVSQQCIAGAALLARGKSCEQLKKITMMDIMELVGQLPDSHLHCAQLAETTLQRALDEYDLQGKGVKVK
jgi:NifU-like protein involved in Fe-S cluster formation